MFRIRSRRIVIFVSLFLVGCGNITRDSIPVADESVDGFLPPAAEHALRESTVFELLSLDPEADEHTADGRNTDDPRFHGWQVLGKTTVKDSDTRAELIARFKAGVAEKIREERNGVSSSLACFDPRHGIRVIRNGTTHEFVICFECLKLEWFIDGEHHERIVVSDSPESAFDDVLQAANVPIARKS